MRKVDFNALLILALSFLLFPLVGAQSPNFDIDLTCYQGCQNNLADVDENIMLKLTLKNNFDYWVYIGDKEEPYESSSVRIIAENTNLKNGKSNDLYQFVIGNPIYIPPKSEEYFYIPLDAYNALSPDNRIGDWSVKAELTRNFNTKYYETPFNGKTAAISSASQIPSQLTTNLLKFESKKEELKVESNNGIVSSILNGLKNFFLDWTGYIIAGIIILVLGSVITYLIKK